MNSITCFVCSLKKALSISAYAVCLSSLSYFYQSEAIQSQTNKSTSFDKNNKSSPKFPSTIPLISKSKIGGTGGINRGPCFTLPFIPAQSVTQSSNPVIWVYVMPTDNAQSRTLSIGYSTLDRSDSDGQAIVAYIQQVIYDKK